MQVARLLMLANQKPVDNTFCVSEYLKSRQAILQQEQECVFFMAGIRLVLCAQQFASPRQERSCASI